MASKFKGGCLCGSIRYEGSADPAMAGNCHCRDCQKSTGGAMASVLAAPAGTIKITGKPKYFAVKGESGKSVQRGFCADCGSPLFSKVEAIPDMLFVKAGTLDDPTYFKPAFDIFTSSAQPWDHMNPALPKFPKMPG
jgi:hypothetical protein